MGDWGGHPPRCRVLVDWSNHEYQVSPDMGFAVLDREPWLYVMLFWTLTAALTLNLNLNFPAQSWLLFVGTSDYCGCCRSDKHILLFQTCSTWVDIGDSWQLDVSKFLNWIMHINISTNSATPKFEIEYCISRFKNTLCHPKFCILCTANLCTAYCAC